MSVLDPQVIRRELLLEQAIQKRLDDVVRQATRTTLLLEGKAMETSQLRNLLNVAMESGSIEVIVNFVRYQIARKVGAWGTGPADFGHRVIEDVRGYIKVLSDEVAADVQKEISTTQEQGTIASFQSEAYVRLTTLYLGYLHRSFYHANKVGSFDALKEVVRV